MPESQGAVLVRCAVLGSPIRHSLSPVLHRAAYDALGLDDWTYDAYEVDEAGLADFVAGLDSTWRGLSLTMPLKRVAIDLCDEVSPLALEVQAVNTMLLEPDGRRSGTNTDVPGVVAALRERGVDRVGAATILGVGATAGSALAGLTALDVARVTAVARDPARADALRVLAKRLDVELEVRSWEAFAAGDAPTVDVAVSTVPAAAAAPVGGLVAERARVVFDVVYDPWPTPLGRAAEEAGRIAVNGLDLLIHQAAVQVELMTSRAPAPVAAMREAGSAALAARSAAAE